MLMIFQNVIFYIHSSVLFISHLHFFAQSCLLPQYFSAIRTAAAALLSSFSILLVFPLIANATARYNWLLPACSGSSCLSRLAVCVCVWLDKVLAKLVGLCSSATRATYRTWTRYSWHNISKIRKKLPAYYWHWAKRSIARKAERGGEREREIGRQTSETCETIRAIHTNFNANKASLWQIGSSV